MATCCIPGCENELTGKARLRTCANCRSHMHRWDKRREAEIVNYSHQLRVRTARMNTFAVVNDDGVTKRNHFELEKKRLLSFPIRKAREKAKVLEFKLRNRDNKKRANR